MSCGQLAWKNMETCSKGMVKRNRTSLRWLHTWPENSGLLRDVILTHLSVLVLTSSVTVPETFHTNRNSRENICSHMPQCQGMKQQPKLPNSSRRLQLARLSCGDPDNTSWRSQQCILKRTTYLLLEQEFLHPSSNDTGTLPLVAAPSSELWLEAGIRSLAKWQLKQFPKVY